MTARTPGPVSQTMRRGLFVLPLMWRSRWVRVPLLRDWLSGEAPTSVVYPPLELAYGAAVARELGCEVDVVDACALGLTHEGVVRRARAFRPDYVVIPSTRFSGSDDAALIVKLRRALPGLKVVASGQNVSAAPAAYVETGLVDYAIHGELEVGLRSVLIEAGGANVAWRDADGTARVGPQTLVDDLDTLPFPARDLLPNARYRTHYTRRNPFTLAITARGCAYGCTFCELPKVTMGKVRFRAPERVVDELETLPALGIREVMFRDGTFTLRRAHALSISEEIARRGLDLAWKCTTTVDRVDPELLAAMRRAGCHLVSFGFESGDQGRLDATGKGTTVEQGRDAAAMAREAGLEVIGFFMIGIDGETRETAERTMRFARELDLDYAQFMVYQPVGTSETRDAPFADEQPDSSVLSRAALEGTGPFAPPELVRLNARAYRSFYLRPRYWWKVLRKVRGPRDLAVKLGAGAELVWFNVTRQVLASRLVRAVAERSGAASA